MNIVVGFAPLKPAEFVILRIRQTAAPPGGPDARPRINLFLHPVA